MLDVWKKNFRYKFAYAVFKDREKRWFLFLENAPVSIRSKNIQKQFKNYLDELSKI